MNHSTAAINLIKSVEGVKLTTYLDPRGIPTIGYGHTGTFAKIGATITQEQADYLLGTDISDVDVTIRRLVTSTLTQNQYDALVSFVFNIGKGHFASSTVLKMLNANQIQDARNHFMDWVKITLPSGQKVTSPGLVNRRKAEQAVFDGKVLG